MALSRLMWFGTKQFSRWIKTHSPGSDYSMGGYSERLEYLNGGVGMRGSINGHAERTITWNTVTAREAREISDFAYGAYGDGTIYFLDPASMDQNALNKQWSMPALTGKDGVPLAGSVRPELVANSDQSYGYPSQMAKYNLSATDAARTFYAPVPAGYAAWVGAHGDIDSPLKVRIQPTVRGVQSGEPTDIPVSGVDTEVRVTHSFAGADQGGVELSIEPGDGWITLAGLIVQILPAGVTPETGPFISGQGQGGMQFEGRVQATPYALAYDSFGLSVKLVETEG